jgi:hypothetical protein
MLVTQTNVCKSWNYVLGGTVVLFLIEGIMHDEIGYKTYSERVTS